MKVIAIAPILPGIGGNAAFHGPGKVYFQLQLGMKLLPECVS
jgi:hypothetical protein